MLYYTYVLYSLKDGKLYIGSTSDILRRISDHNRGKVKSTRYRVPFNLVHYESFDSKSASLARERESKQELKSIKMRDFKRELRSQGKFGQFLSLDDLTN